MRRRAFVPALSGLRSGRRGGTERGAFLAGDEFRFEVAVDPKVRATTEGARPQRLETGALRVTSAFYFGFRDIQIWSCRWQTRGVEELGHSRYQLSGREGLLQQDAVGNALGRPLVACASSHVDDRKSGVHFPRPPSCDPPVHAASEADVHDEALTLLATLKQGNSLFG